MSQGLVCLKEWSDFVYILKDTVKQKFSDTPKHATRHTNWYLLLGCNIFYQHRRVFARDIRGFRYNKL